MEIEEIIKKGNLKITCFEEFPFDELSEIVKTIQQRGYKATFLERGVIVLQKIRDNN